MGTVIYYFTSTGNSIDIARRMAKTLKDCTIRSMTAGMPAGPVGGPGETIGFVFPVFFVTPPRPVRRFVAKLEIRPGTYCFAFVNFGGNEGDTVGILDDLLRAKGTSLSFAATAKMPGNYIVKYSPPDPPKEGMIRDTAMRQVDEAAMAIARGDRRPVKRTLGGRLLSKIGSTMYKDDGGWDAKFTVSDKCNGCGTCARICPASNIKITGGRPGWEHRCEQCLRCIQWCPREAIDYGPGTVGRRRYRNPGVPVRDLVERPGQATAGSSDDVPDGPVN